MRRPGGSAIKELGIPPVDGDHTCTNAYSHIAECPSEWSMRSVHRETACHAWNLNNDSDNHADHVGRTCPILSEIFYELLCI